MDGKRDADAEPGYGYATSYTHRSPQGLSLGYGGYRYGGYGGYYGKRDAEPGYGYAAVAYHPYGGSSSVYRSTQGLTGGYGYGYYGKRDAEPGYGYGSGYSFVHQSRPYYHGSYGYNINHSYGKRSAEPGYGYGGYGYGGSYSSQYVSRPYSNYGLNVAHPY